MQNEEDYYWYGLLIFNLERESNVNWFEIEISWKIERNSWKMKNIYISKMFPGL